MRFRIPQKFKCVNCYRNLSNTEKVVRLDHGFMCLSCNKKRVEAIKKTINKMQEEYDNLPVIIKKWKRIKYFILNPKALWIKIKRMLKWN